MIPLIGLILGLIIGLVININVPEAYGVYIAVAVLVAMASLIRAIAELRENTFRQRLTLLSFCGNMLVALSIVALGQQLNVALNYVVYFAFGNQIFQSLNQIWKQIVLELEEKSKKIKP